MGIRYKFERLFGRSLRGGAKIALFIDIAFGVAGTIFALWTSVRPRVDDYGNAAPSLWEQCGALEVLGGSLLVGLMGFVLAFALHMGVRYLKHLWKSSALGGLHLMRTPFGRFFSGANLRKKRPNGVFKKMTPFRAAAAAAPCRRPPRSAHAGGMPGEARYRLAKNVTQAER